MKARSYDQLPHTYKFTTDMELLYTNSNNTSSPTNGMDQSGPPSDDDPAVDDTSVVFSIGPIFCSIEMFMIVWGFMPTMIRENLIS